MRGRHVPANKRTLALRTSDVTCEEYAADLVQIVISYETKCIW